jgi:hypothetical protein
VKSIVGSIVFLILFVLAFLYGAFAMGFVGMKLWAWFVVPVFGLPALSWGQSYGLALIVGLYTHQLHVNTNKDERESHTKIGHAIGAILIPWFFLLVGWIGKTYFI